uniref:E3 ubiquitin-protein ligase RFWD3 n=1 Tax=Tanacetum cinerariifolium TaxID=118510 RepID=A0A6L2NKC1_TANCI|nr:E3 ubiquitin-protein ligase RFWD3 [Tanacetum cinerariifolium]
MLIQVEEGKEDYEVACWIGGDGTIVHGVVIKLAGDRAKNKKFIRKQRHICPICFDDWTTDRDHRICCLPCGHVCGMSCIKQWLERKDEACDKCPLCKKSCSAEDIKVLYANCLEVATVVHQRLQKV